MSEIDPEAYEEYLDHLRQAVESTERALEALYKPSGVKRGVGYRLRLGNAQNALMTLLVREVNNKVGYHGENKHEWEEVGSHWECVFCELRTRPKMIRGKIVFAPDVLGRIPLTGRKWHCRGRI